MISVITPTVRVEGLKLVEKALNRQTFRNFEWIVQEPTRPLPKDCVWQLNYDYNRAVEKAKGDLIVSWQDYTYAKPDTLEKFWKHYQDEPKTLVGAVGNKYADESWSVMTWKDPRERDDQGSFYPCYFSDIEWNLASIPKEAIYAVGGLDEGLDTGFGMDAYSVNERLNILGGYDFKLDQTIKSYSLEHGRLTKDWDEKNWLFKWDKEVRPRYLQNPVLNYLANPYKA